jgi:hypothetical protein
MIGPAVLKNNVLEEILCVDSLSRYFMIKIALKQAGDL